MHQQHLEPQATLESRKEISALADAVSAIVPAVNRDELMEQLSGYLKPGDAALILEALSQSDFASELVGKFRGPEVFTDALVDKICEPLVHLEIEKHSFISSESEITE